MALESIISLSDLLISSLLSSTKPQSSALPSPSYLKFTSRFSISLRASQHMSVKTFKAEHDDFINCVAYPSFANANLVFFKSGYYNVEVVPKDGESEEQLVSDFRRSVFRAGVLQETRRRRFFESFQEKKKRKAREAAKKNRKRRPNPKPKPHSTPEIPKNRETEEDKDNWELPPEETEIPYTNRYNS